MSTDQKARLYEVLEEFDTAMLVTYAAGEVHARPMAIADVDERGEIWFLTSGDSPKSYEIQSAQRAHVICQSERRFVALAGHAEVVHDRGKLDEVWKKAYQAWFPEGKADPNVMLIRVRPDFGEYWDSAGFQGVKYFFEAARAMVAGEKPETDEHQHGKVALG